MIILTDEDISSINCLEVDDCYYITYKSIKNFVQAIESAVLAKLSEQEPVAWMCPDSTIRSYDMGNVSIPLYTHPTPDVVRDAERYQWLRNVAPNMFWDNHDKQIGFVKFDTKAYLWNPEVFDAAIDKARGAE